MGRCLKCSDAVAAPLGLRAGAVLSAILLSALMTPSGVQAETADIVAGPYVQFTGPFTAVVRWDTGRPLNSVVEYGTTNSLGLRVENPSTETSHEIALSDLQYRTVYHYRVGSGNGATEHFSDVYRFDNSINYTRLDCSNMESPYPADSLTPFYETAAEQIIDQTGIEKGFCLVYGCGEGRLAFELAKRSDLVIVGVDTD